MVPQLETDEDDPPPPPLHETVNIKDNKKNESLKKMIKKEILTNIIYLSKIIIIKFL